MSAITDQPSEHWTEIIEPKTRLLDLRLNELWRYRDPVWFVCNWPQNLFAQTSVPGHGIATAH